ncbi:hypothetical protein BsWGS_11499 [Bradybaena similaris]
MLSNMTVPTLLRGNEPSNESARVIHLVFATYSLRASMLVLLFICSVVIYNVLLLVIKDLWKAHREVMISYGLDQYQCKVYRERIQRFSNHCCMPKRNTIDNI